MPDVLELDCTVAGGYAAIDLSGPPYAGVQSEVWIEFDVAFSAAMLAGLTAAPSVFQRFLVAQDSSGNNVTLSLDPDGSGGFQIETLIQGTPSPGAGLIPTFVEYTPPATVAALHLYHFRVQLIGHATTPTVNVWMDGTHIGSFTGVATFADIKFVRLDGSGYTGSGALEWFDNFTLATTRGGLDLATDDFSEAGPDPYPGIWTGFANASLVNDPGVAPPSAPTLGLAIKLYDLGVTELADISGIALEKSLVRQLNGPRMFTVTAPAGHPLLTAIAADTYPNLRFGNRKLVVWEDSVPETTDPIFHGRIFTVERDGDQNSVQAKITAYDPWMELGFDADQRAGRPVRDSATTTFGDPSFLTPSFTSSVPGQAEVSGPDLIQQILTYSQEDPTTDPIQGEGPLPIDIISGAWDLAVPPAIDLNPVDSADWPVLIGDFINQLVQSGAVDFDLRPIRPGTGFNVNGDLDDYIMVEASAQSKMGTDRSGTVHFDFLTGAYNASGCRLVDDFSTLCQRLWYELGPRIDQTHWRADITPHSSGELGDASAAIYGGPDSPPGYFASIRVEDAIGTEASSRPLYTALYFDETGLRRDPRRLLYVTPAPDNKAIFDAPQDYDVYDVIQIKTGAGFGEVLDEAQRIYGYTKTWSRENVSSVGELLTSADYTVGG